MFQCCWKTQRLKGKPCDSEVEAGLFFFLTTVFHKNEEFNIRVLVLLSNVHLTNGVGGCQVKSQLLIGTIRNSP